LFLKRLTKFITFACIFLGMEAKAERKSEEIATCGAKLTVNQPPWG
jgi:hypothetical protein